MIKTNDNSKEYTIFITCKGGKPYSLLTYNNLFEAKQKLYEMIDLEKERRRPYYVFNDFYENEYPASLNCKIFCLKEREITDWENYSEKEKQEDKLTNGKIYKFPKKYLNL